MQVEEAQCPEKKNFSGGVCPNLITLSRLPWRLCGKESAFNAGDNARDKGSMSEGEDPLEEGMAVYSSILAWRIPWTEEPDGL